MKKIVIFLMVSALLFSLCACDSGTEKSLGTNTKTVSDVLEQGVSSQTQTEEETQEKSTADPDTLSSDVDVDLTALSSTMVYSEVLNMVQSPKSYEGKSVKMSGEFAATEANGRIYYACIIKDAAACCANGIEFLWKGDHSYPEDYPSLGSQITVVGDFDTYYEGSQIYIQLIDAEVAF